MKIEYFEGWNNRKWKRPKETEMKIMGNEGKLRGRNKKKKIQRWEKFRRIIFVLSCLDTLYKRMSENGNPELGNIVSVEHFKILC